MTVTDQIAKDASNHFSSCILPYVERLVSNKGEKSGDEIGQTLERAKIVNNGIITSEHSWLAPRVEGWRNTQSSSSRSSVPAPELPHTDPPAPKPSLLKEKKKRVLLLGSGLVAGPAVDVFVARGDVDLVIGMLAYQYYFSLIPQRATTSLRRHC
jgi:alpha-aminoadipic semialdehyde synthase